MKDGILLLTPREKEALFLLSKGMTYKEISEQMEISHETVKKHLKNILSTSLMKTSNNSNDSNELKSSSPRRLVFALIHLNFKQHQWKPKRRLVQ